MMTNKTSKGEGVEDLYTVVMVMFGQNSKEVTNLIFMASDMDGSVGDHHCTKWRWS
jgi:hypothetical protein